MNKTSSNGIVYTLIDYDDCPDDLIIIDKYNQHEFEDYYYSPENNRFYLDTGVNLREIPICYNNKGSALVYLRNTLNKQATIYFTKFKRLYGFTF